MKVKMKSKQTGLKFILQNDSGVAIIMVLSAIVLLTTIMMNFSFESNINRIKAYNIENKGQAKLTAESGLQFAMVRLRLYQEAFNYLETNKAAKDFATPEVLNSIWNFPFVYPIPVTNKMNAIQKESISKFTENTFLQGELNLVINNLSQRINLNLLRVSLLAQAVKANEENTVNEDEDDVKKDADFNVENQLIRSLKYSIEKTSEKDEIFSGKYFGLDPINLVNELKVYLSDPNSLEDDGGASSEFEKIGLTLKRAPIASFSELYTMPNWDDDLVNLIKGEFTVYGALMVDLNKITDKMLRLLIPSITDQEVKEFFEYRDDPENPKFFNKSEDFKRYIVDVGNVLDSDEYDKRIAKFEVQGLRFGPTPSLFQVKSVGKKDRATYTITAYVSIPAKPALKPKKTETVDDNEETIDDENPEKPETPQPTNPGATEKPEQKTQLLVPRILEIFIS
jgi:hypothetical protein